MAKVYVSSTLLDLKLERSLVLKWLAEHHHRGVHSYVADSESPKTSCISDVLSCDAYVVIVGRRYGYVPADENPRGLSITELEYEAALSLNQSDARVPIIVLMIKYVPEDVDLTDLDDECAYLKVLTFRKRLSKSHRAAVVDSRSGLLLAVDVAFARLLPHNPFEHPDVARTFAQFGMQLAMKDNQIETLERAVEQLKVRQQPA